MIYSMAIFDIMQAIENAFRGLLGLLCILIYNLIGPVYNFFITISRINILAENDIVETLYNRVGMILGIFMVFKLVFSLIQALLEPDKLTDKNKGAVALIKRSVISIVLLGITPTIFYEAYDLQATLIGAKSSSDNVIYKFIFGNSGSNSNNFGKELAAEFYFTFFRDENGDLSPEIDNKEAFEIFTGDELTNLKEKIINDEKLGFMETYDFLMMTINGEYVIEFEPLLCLAAGVLVLWMMVVYCFQVAVRVFQLAYLQLIAPVPILSYISEPEGSFQKWIKQCTSTFLDLFLRLAIIYFVMYMTKEIQELFKGMSYDDTLIEIVLILGLLMFAKKVPDLLKEVLPSMGGSGFSFGLKAPKEATGLATLGAGVAIGGVAGLATGIKHGEGWKGKLGGAFTGLGRGVLSSRTKGNVFGNAKKGMANQRAAAQKAYERHHDGSTWFGRNLGAVGAARTKEAFDKELATYDAYAANAKIVNDEIEKNSDVQLAMAEEQALIDRAKNGEVITAAELDKAKEKVKLYKESVLQQEMAKKSNKTLMSALQNAEAIKNQGIKSGYKAFENYKNKNVSEYADDFLNSVKSTKAETFDIKNPGGTRNKEYKQAEANAKYNKTK